MKNQALFSSKDKSKKLKCGLLQTVFGALRVKFSHQLGSTNSSKMQSDRPSYGHGYHVLNYKSSPPIRTHKIVALLALRCLCGSRAAGL